jgi:hypothetical protein
VRLLLWIRDAMERDVAAGGGGALIAGIIILAVLVWIF